MDAQMFSFADAFVDSISISTAILRSSIIVPSRTIFWWLASKCNCVIIKNHCTDISCAIVDVVELLGRSIDNSKFIENGGFYMIFVMSMAIIWMFMFYGMMIAAVEFVIAFDKRNHATLDRDPETETE